MKRVFHIIVCLCIFGTIYAQQTLPLALDSCLAWAKQNNTQIRLSHLDMAAAKEVQRQVLTKFFPQVSASGMAFHAARPVVEFDVTDLLSTTDAKNLLNSVYEFAQQNINDSISKEIGLVQAGYSVGAFAYQPIYMGGRIVNGYKLSKLGVEAAQLQAQVSEREALQEVEDTYWMIAALQAKRQLIEAAINLLDTIDYVANMAYESGIVTQNDLLSAKLKRNEILTQEMQLENGIRLATEMLYVLIGKTLEHEPLLEELPASIDEIEMPILLDSISISNRPETELLSMQVRAEKLRKKMTLGESLPMVVVGANGSYAKYIDKGRPNVLGVAMVTIPISQWWETSHKIREHNIRIQQAELQQADLNVKMRLQNTQVYNRLNESIQLLTQLESSIEMARDNYRLSLLNYEAGMCTMSDLLQAQTLLLQAENAFADAYVAIRSAKSQFERLND